jgi:nucleoside-diphosphate-sugar epimerase
MYYKDAASALLRLAAAPMAEIKMGMYVVAGSTPTAQAIADAVQRRLPMAQITFRPDPDLQPILDKALLPFDDRLARQEWGWQPAYDLEEMVDDFLHELEIHSARYL